ncbi:hypothetical protein [Streptomyces sp. SID1046]|uniref:hypothetical protein n=1 Tax=Streptomyces sp. SID1046 TaxID=2690249 RepID=UPI0019291E02|nr:hypothetical protein [Streptomyces sp. SID1046]
MSAENGGGGIPELVTFTEIAKRLNASDFMPRSITRQGVRHIADADPDWPVPPDQWMKIGNAWAMPWLPIEAFFRNRIRRGRGAAKPSTDT